MYESQAERDVFFKHADQYRPVQELGRGAFGYAIKVYDEVEELHKVIKLPKDRSVNGALLQEGAILRKLSQQRLPNIIHLYGCNRIKMEWEGVHEERYYLLMEFGGTSLRAKLGNLRKVADRDRRVSYRGSGKGIAVEQALQIAIDACNGLAAAHGFKGGPVRLIHRDVKPENILIDDETGVARLADFGLSRIIDQTRALASYGGTPIYMEPECCLGRASIQSDLFSLGVVLYEMLTGDLPFPTVYSRLEGPPARPRRHVPDLPEELDRIAMRMLEVRMPEQRYAGAAEMLGDLQRVLAGLNVPPRRHDDLGASADGDPSSRDVEPDGRVPEGGEESVRPGEDLSTIVPPGQGKAILEVQFDRLRASLGAERWREADEETCRALLTIAGRQAEGWLRRADIERLPETALRRVDDFWREASGGRFGLSVQRRIWSATAATPERFDDRDLRAFGERVGWRVEEKWLRRDAELRFSLDAPAGHLPSLRFPAFERTDNWWEDWRACMKGFLTRGDELLPRFSST